MHSRFPSGPVRVCFLVSLLTLLALAPLSRVAYASGSGTLPSAWGYNPYGQLGNGAFTTGGAAAVPTAAVVPGLNGVTSLAAGGFHSLALKADGTVCAWGNNQNGQLGIGTFTTSDPYGIASPATIPGLDHVVALAGGGSHSLALKDDGTVWSWGRNSEGELGNGTISGSAPFGSASPGQVPSLSGVIAIAAGSLHSLALRTDGTVWAWGDNQYGKLGDGTLAVRSSPVQVIAADDSPLSDVVAVSAALHHSLALKRDGTVWAWGYNAYGQLGDGTVATNSPYGKLKASLVPDLTGIVGIAAAGYHSLALAANHTVWAWGNNQYGQIGTGSVPSSAPFGIPSPSQVVGLTGVAALSGGDNHSLALKSDGTVWAWGSNTHGQLGNSTVATTPPLGSAVPAPVSSLSNVASISGGSYHNLALSVIPDTTPPVCGAAVVGTNGSGQATVTVTVQDTGSGLAGITVVATSNCGLTWTSFTPGSNGVVTVTATKVNQAQRASFTFRATDRSGNSTTFDPVVAQVTIPVGRTGAVRSFRGIPASEHVLSISNGSPGVSRLWISINGGTSKALELAPGQTAVTDLAGAMRSGSNTITAIAQGPAGGAAGILLSDGGAGAPAPSRTRNVDWCH